MSTTPVQSFRRLSTVVVVAAMCGAAAMAQSTSSGQRAGTPAKPGEQAKFKAIWEPWGRRP